MFGLHRPTLFFRDNGFLDIRDKLTSCPPRLQSHSKSLPAALREAQPAGI